MKTQLKNQQNQTNARIKALITFISVISVLALSGCQGTSTVTRDQSPFPNVTVSRDLVLTAVVFPDDNSSVDPDRQNVHLIGTHSYVEKIMSIYENRDIHRLPTNTGREDYQGTSMVPILIYKF